MTGYNFKLEWDEIPEEFREQKIDQYLENKYQTLGMTDEEKEEHPVESYRENEDIRAEAEETIKRYFPVYF